jgi:succinate dehydrogenase / fumarate reductase iron-sulfur subunit
MQINLKIWRQANPESAGKLEEYTVADAHPSMSFIELLDVLNERLIKEHQEPVAFDN